MSQLFDKPLPPVAGNRPCLRQRAMAKAGGTCVAAGSLAVQVAWLAICSATLMGCIITRDFDYEPAPNVPASVEDWPTATNPMSRIIRLTTQASGGDAGEATDVLFEALVRDPNVDQELVGAVYVDYVPSFPRIAPEYVIPIAVEQDSNPVDRRVSFRLPASRFGVNNCHRIELLVSRAFQNAPNERQPREDGDLGVGVWWLSAVGAQPVDIATCPR